MSKVQLLTQRVLFVLALFFPLINQNLYACKVGTVIQSTAKATYTINHQEYNTISNTVEVIKAKKQSKNKIEFFKYSLDSKDLIKVSKTYYLNNGQLTFIKPLLEIDKLLPVVKTTNFNTNDTIMIKITNQLQNIDTKKRDTINIQIKNSNCDKEIITLTEDNLNSGQFIGYIHITMDNHKKNISDGYIYIDTDTDITITEMVTNTKSRSIKKGLSHTIRISKSMTLSSFEELEAKKIWITNNLTKNNISIGEHVKCNVKIKTNQIENIDNLEVHLQLPRGVSIEEKSLKNQGITTKTTNENIIKFKIGQKLEFSYLLRVGVTYNKNILLNSWVEQNNKIVSNFSNVVLSIKKDLDKTKAFIFGEITGIDKKYLKGIKLYLENGVSTLTDADGKYHFEGIEAGTHILQIDTDSLDGEIENISQFVDLKVGGIKRVDFKIFKKRVQNKKEDTKDFKILTKKSPKMPKYEAKDITSKTKWLWPQEGYNPPIPSIKVAIQHHKDDKIKLYLNDKEVSLLNYDGQVRDQKKKNTISIYRGVDIISGDNILTAEIISQKGKVKKILKKKIHLSTIPSSVKLLEDRSFLIADGKHPPILAVKLVDNQGYPIRDDIQGTFTLDSPYTILNKNNFSINPLSKIGTRDKYIVYGDGITYIKLSPTTESGEVKLHFNLQNRDEIIRAWLKPKAREWLVVGFAEGTIGFNTLKDHVKSTKDNTRLYRKGQVALFAKGKIKGDYLLTIAYDSGKEKDLELFESIDPDKYYTIYHDKSIQKNEAQSKKRLYLKIEKDKFYMLFGDIKTSLDVTELSKYQVSLNGIKSEYKSKKYEYSVFISDTKNIFIKDEIQGDGTSGIYHLKHKDILINSEMITIEIRDRYRDEKILDTQILKRYRDYSIDYDNGEIYFKEPIFSQDNDGNKRFIVVDYEIDGDGESKYTYGGRGALKFKDEKIIVGSTYIKENNGKKTNQLIGIDSTIKINKKLQVKGEYATTRSTLDKKDIEGEAFLLEARYNDRLFKANLYIRQENNAFGLGQQKQSSKHHRKSGVDITLNYWQYIAMKLLAYEDKDLKSNDIKQSAEIIARFKQKHFDVDGGFRYGQINNTKSTQLLLNTSKSVFNNKVKLKINHELALKNKSDEFPTRTRISAEYTINNYIDLFLMNERSDGDITKLNQNHLGIRSKLWKNSQITNDITSEKRNDQYKLYNNLGITQKWQINKKVSINGGVERRKSIKSDANDSEDFIAYSASISYNNKGYNYNSKIEYRDEKKEDKININLGMYKEVQSDLGIVLGIRSNSIKGLKHSEKLNTNFSFVYRPQDTWLILNRFDFIRLNKSNEKMKKFINNLLLNYQPLDNLELSLQYGLKYIQENIDNQTFDTVIDLLGVDIVYNISTKYEIGLHTSLLHSYQSDQFDYSLGVHGAYNVTKNSWLALGYNLEGFNDLDFSSQNYRTQGPYIQLRVKFNQLSLKEFLQEI